MSVKPSPNYPILDDIAIPEKVLENWQVTVDLLSEIANMPAALIMRVHRRDIEVFVSSHSEGNVYHHGEKALLNTGLYCETVMNTQQNLVVPNALKDSEWDHNPDIVLGMISYCGLPLVWPDGKIFGTICILDNQEHVYTPKTLDLLERFRDSVQFNLNSIYEANTALIKKDVAEIALRESEELSRKIVEGVKDYAIIMLDPHGYIMTWNQGAERIKGYLADEIIGQHFSCYYLKEDIERGKPEQELAIALADGRFEGEAWRVRKDGSCFMASVVITALRDETGELRGFVKVTRDITERRQAEQDKQASEQKLRAFYELDLVGLAITSPEKGWISVNNCLCKMLEYTEQELREMTWAQLTHPEDLAADVEQFTKLLSNEIDGYSLEKRFINRSGSIIYTQLVVRCVRKNNGEIDYAVAMVEDISERKRMEIELRRSEERFRATSDVSPLAIYLSVGIAQKASYINPTFVRLFGYTLDEVPSVAQWWPKAYPDENYRKQISDEWNQKVTHAIETKSEIEPIETIVTCKDGSQKYIRWGFRSSGEENWAFGLDLTERKRSEAELEQHRHHLEDLVEVRTHELALVNAALEEEISLHKKVESKLDAFNRDFEAFLNQTTDFIYFRSYALTGDVK